MIAQRRRKEAEMAERKLINEQDHSTFTLAFEKAARLPTKEDRKAALEQTAADMRSELFKPKYDAGTQRDTRRAGNGSGWSNEVPIGPPPGINHIDNLVENSTVVGGVSRSEARRMLERLMRENPNDPKLVAAKEALEKEQKDGGA
jgi:hypothetical protein